MTYEYYVYKIYTSHFCPLSFTTNYQALLNQAWVGGGHGPRASIVRIYLGASDLSIIWFVIGYNTA